ncbi:RNA polymerase sigma-70 factor, ECF subfamily [Fontibacillus panacisegetis]|uniref:RNA polymerase sigma-70 factor, ECF subfamily n=1 Tax=Fontibacillus panacisegetis TaxID=670482 RepID=A0A1G7MXF7_9BACL|nr:sigma-70 family RNA polymerase sigma factor [Fontibacillus panacisegetis]SDF66434.1 RNA polymerase sigma-70 factor, ECF subfamily [Fontibacillus panacisegetis]
MEQWFYFLRSPLDDLDVMIQEFVYRSFYQFVYRDIHFMVHDHALTEDIIQDAFMKAITKGPKMRSGANIPAWIKQLTRNTALDYLRKLNRDRQILAESYVISSGPFNEVSVASEVESRKRDELLYQAMDELKADYRTVLFLFYIEGKTYREICRELNLTEPVLTQRLARARKKLLQHFLGKWTDNDE